MEEEEEVVEIEENEETSVDEASPYADYFYNRYEQAMVNYQEEIISNQENLIEKQISLINNINVIIFVICLMLILSVLRNMLRR